MDNLATRFFDYLDNHLPNVRSMGGANVEAMRLRLLNFTLFLISFLTIALLAFYGPTLISEQVPWTILVPTMLSSLFVLICWQGKTLPYAVRVGSIILFLYLAALLDILLYGLVGQAILLLIVLTVITVILLDIRLAIGFMLFSTVAYTLLAESISRGTLITLSSQSVSALNGWGLSTASFLALTSIIFLLLARLLVDVRNSLVQEQMVNLILQRERQSLDRRIKQRIKGLEASTAISNTLTTILDSESLVTAVVKKIQESLDYYHVRLYLFDSKQQNLTLVADTDTSAKILRQQNYHVKRGEGIIGQVAQTGVVNLITNINDTSESISQEFLPKTQSQATIPVILNEEVIGILDVQHDIENGLTHDDSFVLQLIASQIASGLQNARAFANVQALADKKTRSATIVQQIRSTQMIEETLQVAVSELGKYVGKGKTKIQIGPIS